MSTSIEPKMELQDVLNVMIRQTEYINRLLATQEDQQQHIKRLNHITNFLVTIIKVNSSSLKLQQYEIDFLNSLLEYNK